MHESRRLRCGFTRPLRAPCRRSSVSAGLHVDTQAIEALRVRHLLHQLATRAERRELDLIAPLDLRATQPTNRIHVLFSPLVLRAVANYATTTSAGPTSSRYSDERRITAGRITVS